MNKEQQEILESMKLEGTMDTTIESSQMSLEIYGKFKQAQGAHQKWLEAEANRLNIPEEIRKQYRKYSLPV